MEDIHLNADMRPAKGGAGIAALSPLLLAGVLVCLATTTEVASGDEDPQVATPRAAGLQMAFKRDKVFKTTRLILTGRNFRYTWDTRRGGELSKVEQQGRNKIDEFGNQVKGWWSYQHPWLERSSWQRINSDFAWKSFDTIPALSFSTDRKAYYSGAWKIAYANADRRAKLKVLKKSEDEVVFETESNPRILENQLVKIPWIVRQHVRVFDSGIIVTRLTIELPKGEFYELDWASMSLNLAEPLYKEMYEDMEAHFSFGYAFPGGKEKFSVTGQSSFVNIFGSFGWPFGFVLQGPGARHLPIDLELNPYITYNRRRLPTTFTKEPLLFMSAAYDMTHEPRSAQNAYCECALAEAKSLIGTRKDFGSWIMPHADSGLRKKSGIEQTYRPFTGFGIGWNLFDGEKKGLNEPMTYTNSLTLAFGSRKRSSSPDAPADDRNLLIGSRIYYARDKMPSAAEVAEMAAEGCNLLILGPSWRKDSAATARAVKAAHRLGMRVGATVDLKEMQTLIKDDAWFVSHFQKDRDGLYVAPVNFLGSVIPEGTFKALGEDVHFKRDGSNRVNAAAFAVCMRALRRIVGTRGFLIGNPGPLGPNLLSLAEFDLHASEELKDYRSGTPQQRCFRRYRTGAGFGPVIQSMTPADMALAAIHADTPLILWPTQGKQHLSWWQLCRRLPPEGVRVESDLIAVERHFTTTSPSIHGTYFDGGRGEGILMLGAEKAGSAKVRWSLPGKVLKVTTSDGDEVPVTAGAFDAGSFSEHQVKAFKVSMQTKEE